MPGICWAAWDQLPLVTSPGSTDFLSLRVAAPSSLWGSSGTARSPGIYSSTLRSALLGVTALWHCGGSWGSAAPQIFRDHPEPPDLWGLMMSHRNYSSLIGSTASLSQDGGGIASTPPDSLGGILWCH